MINRNYIIILFIFNLVLITNPMAQDSNDTLVSDTLTEEYVIEQPGTITFKVGVKIKGKVNKPQVIIFLPKERSQYREMDFNYSFRNDIDRPLKFVKIIE